MHPILQSVYLGETPFINDDMEMFPMGPTSAYLNESPNWIEQAPLGGQLIHGPTCSFAMDLTPSVVVSVEVAKRICQIVGYGGWGGALSEILKDEGVVKDTMLEDL